MKDKWPCSYNYKINYSLYFSLQAFKFLMLVTTHTQETLKLIYWLLAGKCNLLCLDYVLCRNWRLLPPQEKQTSIRHVLKPIEMVSLAVISCERQGNMMSRKSRFSATSYFAVIIQSSGLTKVNTLKTSKPQIPVDPGCCQLHVLKLLGPAGAFKSSRCHVLWPFFQ